MKIEPLLTKLDQLFERHCAITAYLVSPESEEAAVNAGADRMHVEAQMLGLVNQICTARKEQRR